MSSICGLSSVYELIISSSYMISLVCDVGHDFELHTSRTDQKKDKISYDLKVFDACCQELRNRADLN